MPEQRENNPESKTSLIKRLVPSSKKTKTVLLLVLGLLIIATLGFVAYRLKDPKNNSNNVGKVGDHVVTKSEVNDTANALKETGFAPESEEQIRGLVMNYWLYNLIAKDYDIKVTDQEALDYLKSQTANIKPTPNLDINNQYVRYRAYTNIFQSRLAKVINTPRSGAYVLAHFDQNIVQSTPQLKALSKEKYEALLAADKKYATDFINSISAKLKSGSITFDQAMELEKNDPKIGQKALPTSAHSSVFGKSEDVGNSAQDISATPEIYDKIKNTKPGETSEPFVIKVQTGANLDSPTVDGIWVLVKVDADNSKGQQFDNINAALQHFKQKYGYEKYN
jgi:hypothetical protein